mgnify:CR=1 FL=1
MTTILRCRICILRVYLDNNLSVTKTASALFLHRSTLLDRLAHITAMLGSDLKDPDYCLTLGIILRAELEQKRTEQARRRESRLNVLTPWERKVEW